MNIIELHGVKKDYSLGKTMVHAIKGVDRGRRRVSAS